MGFGSHFHCARFGFNWKQSWGKKYWGQGSCIECQPLGDFFAGESAPADTVSAEGIEEGERLVEPGVSKSCFGGQFVEWGQSNPLHGSFDVRPYGRWGGSLLK